MKISGFSFVRNGVKLYYPVVEMIRSILPIVDEFVIAVGRGDEDDQTRECIVAINDPRIRIIDTVWEEKYFHRGAINAIQTDIAKNACSGDWLFYLQADEVVHEKYLPIIQERCRQLFERQEVEGLIFNYRHFWGDYDHFQISHGWYRKEIRIIRNRPDIHSWQSAQSFRAFSHYDHPHQPKGHRKLYVATVDAEIYHYGWVRPPHLMQNKKKALDSVHWGIHGAHKIHHYVPSEFDYGPLDRLGRFRGTHPAVMQERIAAFNWAYKLQYTGRPNPARPPHKFEMFRYRLLTMVEKIIGREVGSFHNFHLLKI